MLEAKFRIVYRFLENLDIYCCLPPLDRDLGMENER